MKKSDWHVHCKRYDTLFVEGSVYLYANDIEPLRRFVEEDLKYASWYGLRYRIYALGIENGFFIPSLYGDNVQ